MSTPHPPRERAAVETVLAALDARTAPLPAEEVAAVGAAWRVLAEAVVSPADVPGFARAAMDGYAVRGADTSPPVPLTVVGESFPARPFGGTVGAGQAVRIATGAPVPGGADAVLMAELARLEPDGRVTAAQPVPPGKHVARIGEDVAKGQAVLPAGRRLRPQDVGLLASVGAATVRVHRRPRVAILVTGNELLPPGSVPHGFRIVDSNSPMLAALVARDGGEPLPARPLPDEYATVRDALRSADADVVLVTGGTSVGPEDHAPRAAAELGELAFHGVALRPGGPTGVGFLANPERQRGGSDTRAEADDGVPSTPASGSHPLAGARGSPRSVFLLPGNPVACLCAYDLFAGRVVRRLGGRDRELSYRTASLPLAAPVASAVGRVDYVRVKVEGGRAVPLPSGGAANLSTAVAADGFVLVAHDRAGHEGGETVAVWLYDR